MATKLTAQEAIEKVKNEKTTFLQMEVNKNNYHWEVLDALQVMAENDEILPSEYYMAVKIVHGEMSDCDKEIEYARLEN